MPNRVVNSTDVIGLLIEGFGLTPSDVGPGTPLFSSGLLDSFHLIDVLGRVEQAFGVRVKPSEVSLENFDTAERMTALLNRKLVSA